MIGVLVDLILLGAISLVGKIFGGPKPDRVELPPHVWQGNTLKPHYNRRFLGPRKIKTFLRSSRLMAKTVEKYAHLIDNIDSKYETKQWEFTVHCSEFIAIYPLQEKIRKYMRQIDRRSSLRCYQEWKNDHPKSFEAYHSARNRAFTIDKKLQSICAKHNIPFG